VENNSATGRRRVLSGNEGIRGTGRRATAQRTNLRRLTGLLAGQLHIVRVGETNGEGHPMRQNGTVKFFNASKGYGFITPDDGSKDVFVHVTAVERSGLGTLADGQRVSFETEPDTRGKGPKAVELQPAT
jgi:CspA family cold shock protein